MNRGYVRTEPAEVRFRLDTEAEAEIGGFRRNPSAARGCSHNTSACAERSRKGKRYHALFAYALICVSVVLKVVSELQFRLFIESRVSWDYVKVTFKYSLLK